MHVFKGCDGICLVVTHRLSFWGGMILLCVLALVQAVWQMLSRMCQTFNFQLYVGMGNLFFLLLILWQVLMSDVMKDVATSKHMREFVFHVCSIWIYFSSPIVRVYFSLIILWKFSFPDCSIGIYFSSALVRLCYYLIWWCMSLIFVITSVSWLRFC